MRDEEKTIVHPSSLILHPFESGVLFMLKDSRRQRHGRLLLWIGGVLAALFAGLVAYQQWYNRDRQVQNDELVEHLKKDPLDPVKGQGTDPLDWPQWRGPNRDGIAPGEGLNFTSDGPRLLWTAEAGKGFSSLAVAQVQLVTMFQDGKKEVVLCLDAVT